MNVQIVFLRTRYTTAVSLLPAQTQMAVTLALAMLDILAMEPFVCPIQGAVQTLATPMQLAQMSPEGLTVHVTRITRETGHNVTSNSA